MAFALPEPAPTFKFFHKPAHKPAPAHIPAPGHHASACALFRNPELLLSKPTHATKHAYLKEIRLTDKFCRECPTLKSTNPNFDDLSVYDYEFLCPEVAEIKSNIRLSIVKSSTNIILNALKLIGKKWFWRMKGYKPAPAPAYKSPPAPAYALQTNHCTSPQSHSCYCLQTRTCTANVYRQTTDELIFKSVTYFYTKINQKMKYSRMC